MSPVTIGMVVFLAAQPFGGLASEDRGKEQTEFLKALHKARAGGWVVANSVINVLERTDKESFPGIHAFVADVRRDTKGVDEAVPAADWPAIDVDGLVANNPNFWRAVYEIAPSDPKLLLLHAGLLATSGELTRALFVLQIGKWAPTWPDDLYAVLQRLQAQANDALVRSDQFVQRGIERYDSGDRVAAKQEFEAILKLWPSCSFAHYELGLTVMTDKLEAAGVKQKLKTIQINKSVPGVAEAAPHFSRARLHDPIRWEAYQGSDPAVIKGLQSLLKSRAAIEKMRSTVGFGVRGEMSDETLTQFADACQDAATHEYALVARQVIVARRGRFDASDHPFFITALRALAPSDTTDSVLERLAGSELKMTQLTPTPPRAPEPVSDDASGFAVQAIFLYQSQESLRSRAGNEPKLLGDYINRLKATGQSVWRTLDKADGRAMMVVVLIKPGGQVRFWFNYRGAALDAEIESALRDRFEKTPVPRVHDGPVVFGLVTNLWGGGPNPVRAGTPPANLLFPSDWQSAAKSAGQKLQIPLSDELLALIWPD